MVIDFRDKGEEMSYNSSVYNEDYYKSHCGVCYERGNGWEEIFARQARRIKKEIAPNSVLDIGCAERYLVEGLRDLGIDAKGIDVSSYAISKVRDDIRPFCSVQSATEPIKGTYDLITCIEVMEHLSPEDFSVAIDRMCAATDTIIFSSTPFDVNEETHYSVNSVGFWAERFAYNGFYHDISYDCSYISVQAMLFRKGKKTNNDLVREYEDKLFSLWRENCVLRDNVNLANARIKDLDNGNILHAEEIQNYKCKLNDIQALYENKLKLQKEECASIEQRYRERLSFEYCKRDTLENKTLLQKKRSVFLEKELYKAKQLLNESNNKYLTLLKELNVYKKSKLAKFGYKLSVRLSPLKERFSNHGQCKLLKKEKSYWNPVFNASDYASFNQDIREQFGMNEEKLLRHFICYGMREGRRASRSFDVYAYCDCNPDVEQLYGGDLRDVYLHYIECGQKEKRKATN